MLVRVLALDASAGAGAAIAAVNVAVIAIVSTATISIAAVANLVFAIVCAYLPYGCRSKTLPVILFLGLVIVIDLSSLVILVYVAKFHGTLRLVAAQLCLPDLSRRPIKDGCACVALAAGTNSPKHAATRNELVCSGPI